MNFFFPTTHKATFGADQSKLTSIYSEALSENKNKSEGQKVFQLVAGPIHT